MQKYRKTAVIVLEQCDLVRYSCPAHGRIASRLAAGTISVPCGFAGLTVNSKDTYLHAGVSII
ncbi:MAG TPA: hypothetical protein PLM53_03590 [Spirochaetota bacterium]|nr:hypothetical protein [Spirochaetota bacterium]HPC40267.1 hypothetical protein [Spirochaetota bacterium]HPL15310.1 hypothetical protein [Spirochaetota bacterium]HQF07258.1 hypothetical protein [Spirochaetota bacterium]HQH96159.1 hypothetical protein [Spirochaetota bacterium]